MDTISADLFDFVKSMSRTEKRYCSMGLHKIVKGVKTPTMQSKLFDALNSMEEYEEEKLKSLLAKRLSSTDKTRKFINRLTVEQNKLYQSLLKAIRNYYGDSSDYIKLKEFLISAKQLLDRGLFSQSAKLLGKAKKLAIQYDNQFALLEINRTERSLVWLLKERKKDEEIEQLIAEKEDSLQLLKTELTYQDNYDQMCLETAKHHNLSQRQKEDLKNEFYDFLFNSEQKKQTGYSQLRHIQSKGFYHILMQDQEKTLLTLTEEYQWWEEHPAYKQEDFFRYKISLNNYLLANFRKKEFDIVLSTLSKLEEKKQMGFAESIMLFEFKSMYKFLIYLNKAELEQARAMVDEIKEGLQSYPLSISKKMAITHNIGILYFFSEDFEKSKQWLLKLTGGHSTGNREDIRIFASLLLCLCNHELNAVDDLEKSLRSIDRVLRKNEEIGNDDVEYLVLELIKKVHNVPPSDLPDALSAFITALEATKKHKEKKSTAFVEEFLIWATSRVKKKSMKEVLKDTMKKKQTAST